MNDDDQCGLCVFCGFTHKDMVNGKKVKFFACFFYPPTSKCRPGVKRRDTACHKFEISSTRVEDKAVVKIKRKIAEKKPNVSD